MTELNILLVEDNPGDVRLTQEAFREGSFPARVEAVSDGVSALDYLHQRDVYVHTERPDIILLDINLPRISGHEVLQAVKADDNLKEIPVIMLSSSTADRDIERSLQLHASGYIAKPFDIDGFKRVVSEVERLWNLSNRPST